MKSIYDDVDTTGKKNISIFNKSLNRKVDIVFCFWYNSKEYEDSKNEYYRGVYLYDFTTNNKILDYPFAHIYQVNQKGDRTNDGSRKGIRLLKNIKVDSDQEINLSSFHITTIVHSIDDDLIKYYTGNELDIAKTVSFQLQRLIIDPTYRKSVKSPNGTEKPLTDDTVDDIKKIKKDLDELISDIGREVYYDYFKNKQLIYS